MFLPVLLMVFFQPQFMFSHALTDQYSAEDLRRSSEVSLCVQSSHSILWILDIFPNQNSNFVSSKRTLGISTVPHLMPWPGNSLGNKLRNARAHLICFLILMNYFPLLPEIQFLNFFKIIYVFLIFCLFFSGCPHGKVNSGLWVHLGWKKKCIFYF